MLQAGLGCGLIIGTQLDTVLAGGRGNDPVYAQAGGQRPGIGLHHQLGNVPNRLHLNNGTLFKPEKLVITHRHHVLSRGNIHPGLLENAQVVSATPNPIFIISFSGHEDEVTPLQVRHRGEQRAIDLFKKRIRPGQIFKGESEMNLTIGCENIPKLILQRRRITVVQRGMEGTDPLLVALMNVHGRLTFDRARCQAFDQILLEEKDDQHDGDGS